jgi:exonuclease SbcD
VPPTDAIHLLNEVLDTIVIDLGVPVLAIAGNHDSPSRLNFGSKIMKKNGYYIVGQLTEDLEPVILHDEHGEVHFHLIPYCDPSTVRTIFNDEEVRTHNDATRKIVEQITKKMDQTARHIFVGHAFVTPLGEKQENTSESERPLSIGGAEYIDAHHFEKFHYTALGHLHQAHYVSNETIRYAGSILKYSISEEHHNKGFNIVEIDENGQITLDKISLIPKRDMRTVETTLEELLTHPINHDYVFVTLTDETPILSPMEKVRSVYPNALHIERKNYFISTSSNQNEEPVERTKLSDLELFKAFYREVKGTVVTEETEDIFKKMLDELLINESERSEQS